ncbi:MAG TPA: hypothetical protein VEY31_01830 [Roseococcus sp.]|jgi:hypothetical protein|nr:hypothetical protein [Roseococcus sp.]
MPQHAPQPVPLVLRAFVALAGQGKWHARLRDLGRIAPAGSLAARAAQQRHALELILARLADPAVMARAGLPERRILALAQEAAELARILDPGPRERLRSLVAKGLEGQGTLVPLFHLIRTASILRSRGFTVRHDGILDGASYDLLAQRDHCVAEVVCETISAEEGRPLHKGDWVQLVDRVNPELQTWLAAHPGRYILKMTLPEEVPAGGSETGRIAGLHARITAMLSAQKRQDSSADAMLKLDPLVLAGAQAASDPGRALPARLREVFGVEAHLAVTADPQSGSVLVMAARAGRENEIAQAMKRRLAQAATARLSGRHPGILAVFLEDLEAAEWRSLRTTLELEGVTRRFLTEAEARHVVAVTCATRQELFGLPDAAPEGDLRFRNPAHPAARSQGLEPAIASCG